MISKHFVKELSASGSSSDWAHQRANCERTHHFFQRGAQRALWWTLLKRTQHVARWVFDGRIGGYFLKVLTTVPSGYWGGRIDSELTMNSQCTCWVNTPSPPVTVNTFKIFCFDFFMMFPVRKMVSTFTVFQTM